MIRKRYIPLIMICLMSRALTAAIQEINNLANFEQVLAHNDIVLAQFYSNGCPHCMNFKRAGIYESLAANMPNIMFVKVESEDGATIQHKYGITAFPTFMLFKNGNRVGMKQGFQHKEPLKLFIKQSFVFLPPMIMRCPHYYFLH